MRHLLLLVGILLFIFGYKAFASADNWRTEYDPYICFSGLILIITWGIMNTVHLKKKHQ